MQPRFEHLSCSSLLGTRVGRRAAASRPVCFAPAVRLWGAGTARKSLLLNSTRSCQQLGALYVFVSIEEL